MEKAKRPYLEMAPGRTLLAKKERDYQMCLIPLFCFCCHHCYLVMSFFGSLFFKKKKKTPCFAQSSSK